MTYLRGRNGTGAVAAAFAIATLSAASAAAAGNARSWPPDTTPYARPVIAEDFAPPRPAMHPPALPTRRFTVSVVDAVVTNTNPGLKKTDLFNDGEISLAVARDPPNEIVMTSFSNSWGAGTGRSGGGANRAGSSAGRAPLWLSTDGGGLWAKAFSINRPPRANADGCPCDQTVDFTRSAGLVGAFLTGENNIYSALDQDPAAPKFRWYESPSGTAQPTNHLDGLNNEDQPWLLVGPRPGGAGENVYVAYDDFNTAPDMHVAVAPVRQPLVFKTDNSDGVGTGYVNPGHRLAIDRNSGALYSLFQRRIGAGAGGSQRIDYMLNRSTDGGHTWSLNGSPTGIVVAEADSTQPTPKFCTVNALLGGVDHAAVDPRNGDVFYVYGSRDPGTGNNRLAMRRLTADGSGGLSIGRQILITGQVQAAIPSIAIADNGAIGIFYYTCDGIVAAGYPIFTAHFAVTADRGRSFVDIELERFLSPAADTPDQRQRVLGDYMQVKAVGNRFYGGFTGNGVPFGRRIANNDPIFFTVAVSPANGPVAEESR